MWPLVLEASRGHQVEGGGRAVVPMGRSGRVRPGERGEGFA